MRSRPLCDKHGCMHQASSELLCFWTDSKTQSVCWNVCVHHRQEILESLRNGSLYNGSAPTRITEARRLEW